MLHALHIFPLAFSAKQEYNTNKLNAEVMECKK